MQTEAKDRSIMEAVIRRRERSARLSKLAKELGRETYVQASQTEALSRDSIEAGPAEFVETAVSSAMNNNPVLEEPGEPEIEEVPAAKHESGVALAHAIENEIDEELMGKISSGKSDYGVLDELIPKIDFSAIPLTQPKRVLAKSGVGKAVIFDSESSNGSRDGNAAAKPARRKTKPASLLDSYFKGL